MFAFRVLHVCKYESCEIKYFLVFQLLIYTLKISFKLFVTQKINLLNPFSFSLFKTEKSIMETSYNKELKKIKRKGKRKYEFLIL